MSLQIQVGKTGGAVFFPGEVLSGNVIVTVDGPVACNSIVLTFDGRLSITVDHFSRHHDHTGGGISSSFSSTHIHTSTRQILRNEEIYAQIVLHLAQNLLIPAGTSVHPFQLTLPDTNLPCSFEGPHGTVKYVITARLDQSITSYLHNIMTSLPVTIVPYVDLNVSPLCQQFGPISMGADTDIGCCPCWRKPVNVIVAVVDRAFVPGQNISFDVLINNGSAKPMPCCTMQLLFGITTYAQGEVIPNERVLNQMSGPGVPPMSAETWKITDFFIPVLPMAPLPPTALGGGCRAMDVSYVLRFHLPVETFHTNEVLVNIPILIGTIPIKK